MQARLGTGGMGEVYLAEDVELARKVALKLLPDDVTHDQARLTRFKREARAASALNHPNILTVHEISEENGRHFIATEYVVGETLRQRLEEGALAPREALDIATQVASALAAAHDAGVVHRDIKPENIMVRPDGYVKVVDFGLAKLTPRHKDEPGSPPAQSSLHSTPGLVIGTPGYMSPEQLRGIDVDLRTDIWSFGVVLYEMLSGGRPFAGSTSSDCIVAILTSDAPPLEGPIPDDLRDLVAKALQKDPADRYQTAREMFALLQHAHNISSRRPIVRLLEGSLDAMSRPIEAVTQALRRWRPALPWVAGALVTGTVAGAWWVGRHAAAPDAAWSEFTQLTDASGVETGPSLSPDGGSFAYASAAKGSWDIYVQRVGGRNPCSSLAILPSTNSGPRFSPDATQIAFSRGDAGGIFIMGASGESVRRLTDFGSNPAWSPDGRRIVFGSEEVSSPYRTGTKSTLWTVDVAGGGLSKVDSGVWAYQPAWSPSGRRIAFWARVNDQRDLATVPAADGSRVMVTSDPALDWAPVWSPDGRFLFFASDRGGSMGIWRIAVDESSGRAAGPPKPIAGGVDVSLDLPHVSADGRVLLLRSKIQWVNPAVIDFDPMTERVGT